MENIFGKYPKLQIAIDTDSLESYVEYLHFKEAEYIGNELLKSQLSEDHKSKVKVITNKIMNFDPIKIRKDVEDFIKDNTFKIFRDYKFDYAFPDYIQLKRQFDKEYINLLPRMPNEESRKNLENLLAKRVLEKEDFISYSDNLIKEKLDNFKYYQIDVYESMDKKGLFNTFFGYNL
tara:strand:- start:56593 stop:57123 length:531 start_codon:yes stop_codon:yes gene_type:complete